MEYFRVCIVLGLIGLSFGNVADRAVDTGSIFFRCYKGASYNDVNIKDIANLIPQLNLREETVFHIHGYTENIEHESVKLIVEAYLKYTKKNIIAIDYRQIADDRNYIADVVHVHNVGRVIANALNTLVQKGLNPKSVHIIGHSLGGQVAGYVGLHTKFRLLRITGLDPAGPLFYSGRYLRAGDAEFVVIIHTDEGFLGQVYHSGDVDFLPNGGHRPQPGCPLNPLSKESETNCNHRRSWRYYAESVGNPHGFMAVGCKSGDLFHKKKCDQSNVIFMGYATPSNARGTYYLNTNPRSPFALGKRGIV
ncbi:pancreatic triacylglycerol lipase-like isoform X2 [Augochlora pura]